MRVGATRECGPDPAEATFDWFAERCAFEPDGAVTPDRRGVLAARAVGLRVVRGDLRADADPEIATELLVGPVYFRLMFGGELTLEFADRVVDSVLRGYGTSRGASRTPRRRTVRS